MPATYEEALTEAASDERELVRVQRDGASAIVTLDDPEKLNPLSLALTVQLHQRLRELAEDHEVRAVVITGRDPAFCAGGDLRIMQDVARPMLEQGPEGGADIWRWIRGQFGGIARLITRTDKAFIAAVNGPAAGVGLAFALACDVMLLSERAQVVPAFGRIGLVPEVGSSWALTRRLGYQGALAYYLRGEHIDAHAALRMGLVQEVVAHEQLLAAADRWCDRVSALPAHAAEMTKPLLRTVADSSWEGAITLEEFAEPACFTTQAFAQAVRAAS